MNSIKISLTFVVLAFSMPVFSQVQINPDTIPDGSITNAKLQDATAWTIKGRNNAATGVPQDIAAGDIAEEAVPATGDYLIGFDAANALKKFDVGNLPTGTGASISGTPINNQIAVWTSSTVIEGDPNLTWDGAVLSAFGAASKLDLVDSDTAGSGINTQFSFRDSLDSKKGFFGYQSTDDLIFQNNYATGSIAFKTNAIERVSFSSDGDLTITSGDINLAALALVDGVDISELSGADVSIDDAGLDVLGGADVQALVVDIDRALLSARNTGFLYGGIISLNVAGDSVDVTAGMGSILDNTDAENPTYAEITWTDITDEAVISAGLRTYWYFDALGALNQDTADPTNEQLRTRLYIAETFFQGGVIIGLRTIHQPLQQTGTALHELSIALGEIRLAGLRLASNAGTLNLKVLAGTVFKFGINYNNSYADPNTLIVPELNTGIAGSFNYITPSAFLPTAETEIQVGNYAPAGVVTAIPGATSRIGVHIILHLSTGAFAAVYGDEWFATIADAESYLQSVVVEDLSNSNPSQSFPVGAILAESGETDLSNATFKRTNKLGEF
jgi:hypothetical protein